MRFLTIVLLIVVSFLSYRIIGLEKRVRMLQLEEKAIEQVLVQIVTEMVQEEQPAEKPSPKKQDGLLL